MIRLITAEESYLTQVLEIEWEAISPSWSEGALLGEIGRDDGHFLLAVEDGEDLDDGPDGGRVAGFSIVRRMADEAELYQIAVHEDFRRRGIADLLLGAGLRDCRDKGALSVYLEVRRSNNAAIHLYRKHGFKTEGRRKNYYSSPVEDAVLMTLDLQAE